MAYFAPFINSTGLSIPTYVDILADLKTQAQNIFGSDIYLGNDSQDYQMMSVYALKTYDVMQLAQFVYNCMAPGTATGIGQDLLYKLNGLIRNVAIYSTCPVNLVGSPGTTIPAGLGWVKDVNGIQWSIPSITFGPTGLITVTATCTYPGAIAASPGDINSIVKPTQGWFSVNNTLSATPGVDAETDSNFRGRQASSTANPSLTVLEGTKGAVAAVDGVTRSIIYENDTGITDSNTVPAHSIAAVVENGDPIAVAQAIFDKKGPGCGTYGTSNEMLYDQWNEATVINFFRPTYEPIDTVISIKALSGYTTATVTAIRVAVVAYLNSLQIGNNLPVSSLWGAALSVQELTAPVFSITALTACLHGGSPGTSDIAILFNQVVQGIAGYITITPVISVVSPVTGSHTGGTAVTITGAGFTNVTGVKFGTVSATSVVVVSDTQITCLAPAVSAGTVAVTVINAAGTSPTSSVDQFVFS
jgi:uncharacterized phage protein gp47/JayE